MKTTQPSKYQVQFEREKSALKFYYIGKGFHKALKALGFAERHHNGLRKDKLTPEFHHQIQICLMIVELKDVMYEERLHVAMLLHDTQEDYQISSEEIQTHIGHIAAEDVWLLTKKFGNMVKDTDQIFEDMALNPVASLGKGIDRLHNMKTMIGVFQPVKILAYCKEAKTKILPMLKKASKLFPEQQSAYHIVSEQIKYLIKSSTAYAEQAKLAQDLQADKIHLQKRLETESTGAWKEECVRLRNDLTYTKGKVTDYEQVITAIFEAAGVKTGQELNAKLTKLPAMIDKGTMLYDVCNAVTLTAITTSGKVSMPTAMKIREEVVSKIISQFVDKAEHIDKADTSIVEIKP